MPLGAYSREFGMLSVSLADENLIQIQKRKCKQVGHRLDNL